MNFEELPREDQDAIDAYLNGTISEEAFAQLQDRMLENPPLRVAMRRYLALDSNLRTQQSDSEEATEPWLAVEEPPSPKIVRFPRFRRWMPVAAAAAVAFFLGLAAMSFQRGESGEEPLAEGFAVVGRVFDAMWEEDSYREGDTLGADVFRIASGTAELQFFSGATMTVEGPAEISLKSAWEAECREGSVRVQVPPAARGFKLQAPETQIVDLGTEFGLEVREGKSHVEVFDGEIAVKHQDEDEQLVTTGNALQLPQGGSSAATSTGTVAFPDIDRLGTQADSMRAADFRRWTTHRDELARDPRLIAYYTFDRQLSSPLVPDVKVPRQQDLDGAVILAEPVDGRWPGMKSALEFRRPGARVRVNIPGEFSAYTFAAWVRIDSLDRKYNALFMGDGYENGEPHWQIREDGALMLSVMVNDSIPNPGSPDDAGLHRVYFSPPVWDMSMSGQWLHLASVFDPTNRLVSHYLNGEQISSQEIIDRFFVDTLRIGNGEIGNWGLPFRKDPWFAIRNLNGRMDEIAIFNAALKPVEVMKLYDKSRAATR